MVRDTGINCIVLLQINCEQDEAFFRSIQFRNVFLFYVVISVFNIYLSIFTIAGKFVNF